MAKASKKLTEKQLGAVQRFANRHGKSWALKLASFWSGKLRDENTEDHSVLNELKSEFGLAWLYSDAKAIRPARS